MTFRVGHVTRRLRTARRAWFHKGPGPSQRARFQLSNAWDREVLSPKGYVIHLMKFSDTGRNVTVLINLSSIFNSTGWLRTFTHLSSQIVSIHPFPLHLSMLHLYSSNSGQENRVHTSVITVNIERVILRRWRFPPHDQRWIPVSVHW